MCGMHSVVGTNLQTCYINAFYLRIKGSHPSIVSYCLLMDLLKNGAYNPAKCIQLLPLQLRTLAETQEDKLHFSIYHLIIPR